MSNSCFKCVHSAGQVSETEIECRAHPPQVLSKQVQNSEYGGNFLETKIYSEYPRLDPNSPCGEFKLKGKEK